MVEEIRDIVSRCMNQYSENQHWEETRIMFSVYSYVAFLTIAIKNTTGEVNRVKERAIHVGLDSEDHLNLVFHYPGTEYIIREMAKMMDLEQKIDINATYQAYLSIDYRMRNHRVEFSGGKNGRDTLGSYYTQEEFAYEVTKKAIRDYVTHRIASSGIVRIADFSCGGGAFLLAAYKICKAIGMKATFFGVDVDPIATMIARSRFVEEHIDNHAMQIVLGNPLLTAHHSGESAKAFLMALSGRYYHSSLAIDVDESYDIVIGNPPWEKIRFEEKKFLAHYMDANLIDTKRNREIAVNHSTAENQKYYNLILEDYSNAKEEIKKRDDFVDTKAGELNTYALFTEYALNHISQKGIVGLIVKSSLLKMPVYREFLKHSMVSKKFYEAYMFVNRKKIFCIDSREEFSVVYYCNDNQTNLRIAAGLDEYRRFYAQKKINVSYEVLELINPKTGMVPNITNHEELDFLCGIYETHPVFGEVYANCHFGRLVHLTNHSQHISRERKEGFLPIYEGKFIELYTGNYATFKGMSDSEKYKNKASAIPMADVTGIEYPEARFYIDGIMWKRLSKNFRKDYMIAWRSLTSATNRRTMLATLLPLIPACQSIQMLQLEEIDDMLQILALFNSVIFDYIVRRKMAGLDLTQSIINQIPVPKKESYDALIVFQEKEDSIRNHLYARMEFLYHNDHRVNSLFENYNCCANTNKSRKQIISELDRLVGILYGLSAVQIKKIASTFDKYYGKQEVEQWF